MNDKELIIIKRALLNMLSSMMKSQDAPCSAEMHLIESIVDIAKILNITGFKEQDENEMFEYCTNIMNSLKSTD
ncbi:hypothetical protein GW796_07145 [archaeon]|nr:hypothetical protein [archaeon]